MQYRLSVKERPAQWVATILFEAGPHDAGNRVESTLTEVWSTLEANGAVPAGPPFSLSHHARPGDVPASPPWTIESGFPIEREMRLPPPVHVHQLPAGPVLSTVHEGDYDHLVNAYLALDAELLTRGLATAAAPREIYLTDPVAEPDPSKWRTQIEWPLEEPVDV